MARRGLKGFPGTRWFGLVAAVLVLHGCLIDQVADNVTGWSAEAGSPTRLQVAYVREMIPGPPPAIAAPVAVPPPPSGPPAAANQAAAASPAASAASAPYAPEPSRGDEPPTVSAMAWPAEPAASGPPVAVASTASAPAPASAPPAVTRTASAPDAGAPAAITAAEAAVPASAPASAAAPFTWPASTRLSYRLTGQFRGELNGRAQVEWVQAAPRYQVHLDVVVGLPIAPLYTRRMSSDGRLTAAGLQPERYDELSRMAFRERRQAQLQIDQEGVRLADGRRWTRPSAASPDDPAGAGNAVQDSASQFVQLSYLFTRHPEWLVPGHTISFPLALPRRVEPWVYEVVGAQAQATPFGLIDAVHVRPRRGTPRGNDLLAEAWFSPQLAYLPVRIRIEQDAEVYLDLVLDRRPEMAAR